MSLDNAISLTEPLQDVHTFRRQLPHCTLERESYEGLPVRGLNETCVHETLADRPSHLLGHGKGCGSGRGDDPGRILGVWHTI